MSHAGRKRRGWARSYPRRPRTRLLLWVLAGLAIAPVVASAQEHQGGVPDARALGSAKDRLPGQVRRIAAQLPPGTERRPTRLGHAGTTAEEQSLEATRLLQSRTRQQKPYKFLETLGADRVRARLRRSDELPVARQVDVLPDSVQSNQHEGKLSSPHAPATPPNALTFVPAPPPPKAAEPHANRPTEQEPQVQAADRATARDSATSPPGLAPWLWGLSLLAVAVLIPFGLLLSKASRSTR